MIRAETFFLILHIQHPYGYSPYSSSYIFLGTEKENLFNNKKLLKLVSDYFVYSRDLNLWSMGEVFKEKLDASYS